MIVEDNAFARAVAANAAHTSVKHKTQSVFHPLYRSGRGGSQIRMGIARNDQGFHRVDAALGAVKEAIRQAGLEDRCVLIITADHGGHKKTHGRNIPADVQIPWIAWGKGVKAAF